VCTPQQGVQQAQASGAAATPATMPDHSDVSVDVEGCSAQCEVLKERFGRHRELIGWVVGVGLLLLLVLLPTSFAYVEYYDYGLIQRKSTGRVRTDRV